MIYYSWVVPVLFEKDQTFISNDLQILLCPFNVLRNTIYLQTKYLENWNKCLGFSCHVKLQYPGIPAEHRGLTGVTIGLGQLSCITDMYLCNIIA